MAELNDGHDDSPFFLHFEAMLRAKPNPEARSIYITMLAASRVQTFEMDISLSRPAALSLHQCLGTWLGETEAGEPPRQ